MAKEYRITVRKDKTPPTRQGRPPAEDSAQVRQREQVMLEPGITAQVKEAGRLRGLTFSAMARQLILDGLASLTQPK